MIHASPLPDVAVPPVSVTDYVLADAGRRADRVALVDGPTGRTYTFGEVAQAVDSLAGGLVARGRRPGDVVAVVAPNCPEYAVVFHGVARAGGVVTTVNPTYTEREVHAQLVDSGADLVVVVAPLVGLVEAAAVGTAVREVVVLGEVPEGSGHLGLESLFGPPLGHQVPVSPDDVVALPYSSGTTGLSKGVMLTHRNLVANIEQFCVPAGVHDGETFVAVLPFFHIYGMQVQMNAGLRQGVTLVTLPRFDLQAYLELTQRYGATRAFVAPPIVLALAKHPLVASYDLSSLRQVFSGAAPLSAELAAEAAARIGCEVVQGYGMTEMSPVSQLTPPGGDRPGSVGVTTPNTELRIVAPETGEDVDVDGDGEIWIRGPQVMKGYLNNPVATASTLTPDGWLRTGDIGHVDADGYVYIVDRLKELIKYKGFQVPPAELEAVLLTHPAVADAAVIARPDPEAGEVPVGFVVLKPGAQATPEELAGYVAGQVAHYKRLAAVHVVEEIPKSTSGKILRRLLSEPVG